MRRRTEAARHGSPGLWARPCQRDERAEGPLRAACRARKGHQPGVLAAFNNLAISILRLLGHKNISRAMEEMSRRQAFCLAVA